MTGLITLHLAGLAFWCSRGRSHLQAGSASDAQRFASSYRGASRPLSQLYYLAPGRARLLVLQRKVAPTGQLRFRRSTFRVFLPRSISPTEPALLPCTWQGSPFGAPEEGRTYRPAPLQTLNVSRLPTAEHLAH